MFQKLKLLFIVSFLFLPNATLLPQSITKENIENAEKIIGLEFTDTERDSMLSNLDSQFVNYKHIREIDLNNIVLPAILFNPIPIGFDFPNEQKPLKFSDYSNTKTPGDINDLAFYTIGQLAELIRTKKVTSTELTKFFLERLKKYNPNLHCVITLTEQRALNQAKLHRRPARHETELRVGFSNELHSDPEDAVEHDEPPEYETIGSLPARE